MTKKHNNNKTNRSTIERFGRDPKSRIDVLDVPFERLASESIAKLFALTYIAITSLKYKLKYFF